MSWGERSGISIASPACFTHFRAVLVEIGFFFPFHCRRMGKEAIFNCGGTGTSRYLSPFPRTLNISPRTSSNRSSLDALQASSTRSPALRRVNIISLSWVSARVKNSCNSCLLNQMAAPFLPGNSLRCGTIPTPRAKIPAQLLLWKILIQWSGARGPSRSLFGLFE